MTNRILIFGKGYIGTRLGQGLGAAVSRKRIRTLNDAEKEISRYNPKVIINCVGHIGKRNVDDCDSAKEKTLFANSFVPLILAEAAIRNRIKLIHVSTGCIYRYDYKRDKPITEDRIPDFFGLYYSRTKIYAERALEALARKSDILIVRIRIPLDDRPHPRNILTKLLKYKTLNPLPNSVTYVPDFIRALKHLIRIDSRGIYNLVNKGGLKLDELSKAYQKYGPKLDCKEGKAGMNRTNLILSTRKLEESGFKVRPIKEVLDECVEKYLS